MAVKRQRIRQLTVAREVTEGTEVVPASGNVLGISIFEPSAPYDVPTFERVPSKGDLSEIESISGAKMIDLTFGTDLKGSGTQNTAPEIGKLLEMSGFAPLRVWSIAMDGGSYTYGETVTGGTSSAVGRVLKPLTGAGNLLVTMLDGTFQSGETITGGTSGAADDSTGVPAQNGWVYEPLSKTARYITIGAVTSGPFVAGETVTGGTSSATGRVVYDVTDGDAGIRFIPLTGTFQDAEVITGEVSGASATSSAAPVCEMPTASFSCSLNEDGILKRIKGLRSSMSVEFGNVGEPARVTFTCKGVPVGNPTDASQYAQTQDPLTPPKFQGTTLSIGTYSPIIAGMTVGVENELGPRPDATDASGYKSVIIAGRKVSGKFAPEMVEVATSDFHGNWFSDATAAFNTILGSSAGNIVEVYAPKLKYDTIADEERQGIALAGIDFSLVSGPNGDDEVLFFFR